LRAAGVGAGDFIAVHAHRSATLACALLATWKCRAAFVVLDPAHPAARLAAQVELARPKAWLQIAGAPPVPPSLAAALERHAGESSFVPWDRQAPAWPLERERRARLEPGGPREIRPDDVAYLAFTSGTTGTPKAILGTHAPLAHFLDWHADEFELGE